MGEYGTPDTDIPEGWFDLEFRGRTTRAQFPRKPASLYHASKVSSSTVIEYVCRTWGLRATDIMQGVVYGTRTGEIDGSAPEMRTRFDMDQAFGTAINRFAAQAVAGLPITPYGKGGQTRGYLPLRDSIQCLRILLEAPPQAGEYRVVNQLDKCYTVVDLARTVAREAVMVGIEAADVVHVDNPRVEAESHYYNPDAQILRDLGYQPTGDLPGVVRDMLVDLMPQAGRIARFAGAIAPKTTWRDVK
jgi:nucleoside-diphosphate-sugar epimerase